MMTRNLLAFLLLGLSALGAHAAPPARLVVAFTISDSADVIDFAGPWEVFNQVHVPELGDTMDKMMPFHTYLVGDAKKPVSAWGGMTLVPQYTFADAPRPDIVVIGAQAASAGQVEWLKAQNAKGALLMSVCVGSRILAETGLLDGKQATTHHEYLEKFAAAYPKIQVVSNQRYVESAPKLFTASGLTSGIDLALHVVEIYYGADIAAKTARYIEYHPGRELSLR